MRELEHNPRGRGRLLRVALWVALLICVGLVGVGWFVSESTHHPDRIGRLIMVSSLDTPIKRKQAAKVTGWRPEAGTQQSILDASLEECIATLPFAPAMVSPPRGYKLKSARVYLENGHKSLYLTYERAGLLGIGTAGTMTVVQPQGINPSLIPNRGGNVPVGTASIENQTDKPPADSDGWIRIVQMAVAGFPKDSGVTMYLKGPPCTAPPSDDELVEMVRSYQVVNFGPDPAPAAIRKPQ